MKILGFGLIAIGVAYLFIAFNMDVSVSTSSTYVPGYGSVGGGDVVNLDLIAKRQNHLIIAALITIVGVLMAIFAPNPSTAVEDRSKNQKKDFDGVRDLASDPYRIWLVNFYGIERNEVLSRFVFKEKTFQTLDDALMSAHECEEKKKIEEKENLEANIIAIEKYKSDQLEDKSTVPAVIISIIILFFVAYLVF